MLPWGLREPPTIPERQHLSEEAGVGARQQSRRGRPDQDSRQSDDGRLDQESGIGAPAAGTLLPLEYRLLRSSIQASRALPRTPFQEVSSQH
jgi:hypothetical protein